MDLQQKNEQLVARFKRYISVSNSLIVLNPKKECILLLLNQVSIQEKIDNSA